MLGAQAEVGFDDLDVYQLGVESMRQWPEFASELENSSGVSIDYREEGTLIVADDRDSAAHLKRIFEFQRAHSVPVEWISPIEAQEIEPLLSPRIAAAVYSQADHQVDSRQLVKALVEAFVREGGQLVEQDAVRKIELGGANPVMKTESGKAFESELTIIAAGAWSAGIVGLPETPLPVRPVKGQMLELRMQDPYRLGTVVRGIGSYLAPKRSGRLLVGATSEEMGFDAQVTAGGLYQLLEKAWRLVPGIYEMEVTDSWAGLRPGSPDHAPIVGYSEDRRVVYATGHYRHGILLTPVTASTVVEGIQKNEMPDLLAVCDPRRFDRAKAAAK
jgi:glycine oxidase